MMFLVSAKVDRLLGEGYHWQWSIEALSATAAVNQIQATGYFSGLAKRHFKFYVEEDEWKPKSI